MKVLLVVCLLQVWQVSYSITVPPVWPNNERIKLKRTTVPTTNTPIQDNEQLSIAPIPVKHHPVRIKFKSPTIPTTIPPIKSEQFEFHSFFPQDATPAKTVNKLQYRTPNNQNIFVYHPPVDNSKVEAPQSYQIVHFDNQNLKEQPIKQQFTNTPNNPAIRQHLTEVRPNNNEDTVEYSKEANEKKEQTTLIYPENEQYNKDNEKYVKISNHDAREDESSRPIHPRKGQRNKYRTKHNQGEINVNDSGEKQKLIEHNLPRKVPARLAYHGKGQRINHGQNHNQGQRNVKENHNNSEKNVEESEEISEYSTPRKVSTKPNQYLRTKYVPNQNERNVEDSEENDEIIEHNTPQEVATSPSQSRQFTNYDSKHNNDERNVEESEEKEEISEHEIPREVPTKPIYPGEGKWAKYGLKYKPYIHSESQKPENINEKLKEEINEDKEEKPEGYQTFENGQEQFRQAQQAYHHNINTFPEQHQLPPSKISEIEPESEPLYQKPEIGFVPEKLYTQVRRTETEEHLPRSAIDPDEENAARLREVLKNSKIHTVYTEEGYEDSAYDHAGHEKNAENHEGEARTAEDQIGSRGRSHGGGKEKYFEDGERRHGYNNERRKVNNREKNTNEDYNNSARFRKKSKKLNHDVIEAAGSNVETQTLPSKNIKKVSHKNNKNEQIDMEIYTEVKYTPQKKKHKYIKITPIKNSSNSTDSNIEQLPELKRVKRYDKDKLSKKYVRKRPTYYWKKKRTTTTERSAITTSRRKFEAAFKTSKIEEPELEPVESTSRPITTVKTTSTPRSTTKVTTKATTTTTQPPTTTSSSTTPSTDPTQKPELDVHPDLLNPELTTKSTRPAAPKILPVKIRKFKLKRQKRFTNDFHKINVDLKEFTDVKKISIPTQPPDQTHIKYPYYKLPTSEELNENSPLRYAEDMRNIPIKVENELSFYESRDHIVCPEIESDVNPIPERIQNQKEGEETDKMAETPDLPRLKGLGDKIDCMKIKYFGENPLDSPFFTEEIIKDPIPFFTITKNVEKISPDFVITTDNKKHTKKRELKIKILEPIVVVDEDLIDSATANPIHEKTEAVLKPPYTLLEMMSMNNEKILTPKSIYDQISLLEQEDKKSSKENENLPPAEKFIILYNNQEAAKKKENSTTTKPEVVSSTVKPQQTIRKPKYSAQTQQPTKIVKKLKMKTIRKPTPKTTTTTSTSTTTTTTTTTTTPKPTTTTELPTTQKLVLPAKPLLRTIQKAPQNLVRRPVRPRNNWESANRRIAEIYNIFDVSRYLPKVPRHRLITSEVQYKDLIKPSEQMKVYSDVLQNINNQRENKDTSDSKPIAVTLPVPEEQLQIQGNVQPSSETIVGMLPPSNDGQYKTIDSQEPTDVQPQASQRINYFYVIGMKPPRQSYTKHQISKRDTSKSAQKSEENEDLMMEESQLDYVTSFHRRSKRHLTEDNEDDLEMDGTEIKLVYSSPPQRKPKVYTEIVRQRPSRPATEDPEEEEEDLNPRKRFYEISSSKSSTSTTSAPDEVEEIIEEIQEPSEPTTTAEPVIYPVEANSENPSLAEYIFFIEKLHDKWAKEDATSTTEATTPKEDIKDSQNVMTQVVEETVNIRRGEPAYLQIINQLHEVRKEEEIKTTTEPTTTTTEVYKPVKNSNPFILDPDSFTAEVKSMKAKLDPDNTAEGSNIETTRPRNYSTRFKTNIDTSKYKNIERSPITVRHNLSSRFNADDQLLPLQKDKTTLKPMIIAIITRPHTTTQTPQETTVDYLEEASNRESVSEPSTTESTSTTVKTTVGTTVRSRQRGRIRARPSAATTIKSTSTSVTPNPNFRRRRPIRTTTIPPSTTNISRRRNRQKVEIKSTTESAPETTTETIVLVTPLEEKKQRRFQKVQERRVMSEVTLTRFYEPSSEELDDNTEETKKHQYEVIGPLTNIETGHGGNYKHDKDRKQPKNSEEDTITDVPSFYTDPNLADNVNKLKDDLKTSTEKNQASNSLLTQEETAEKVAQLAHTKVSLYPNMARMVNRLAEKKSDELTTVQDFEEEETTEKPVFITDPSRRMYFYAKL